MSSARAPLRSDAARNRAALLAAADATFAEQGATASLSATAGRAGLAIGTLYKHFPTRRALVGALLAERHDALFAEGEALAGADLGTWVRRLVDHVATYRGLAEVIAATPTGPAAGDEPDIDRLTSDCDRMSALTHDLVEQARRSGRLRDDVTVDDVLALAEAAAWTREHHDAGVAERLVTATLRGLAP